MEQATNALTNKISRFRYLLAAYFDIIIWFRSCLNFSKIFC